jgi:16S rRNA G1207 methylase RsmC
MSDSSDTDSSTATTVTISLERLRKLEECEAMILAERARCKKLLATMVERRDPEEHAKKMLEKYHANRDAILARRRELRAAKKAAAAAATVPA